METLLGNMIQDMRVKVEKDVPVCGDFEAVTAGAALSNPKFCIGWLMLEVRQPPVGLQAGT
ncbi:MAG: hypothetical protein IJ635_05645 [Bacteroidaceae bacterium]|nr:hypothetical protein [Bacteroidaceae bacterium]